MSSPSEHKKKCRRGYRRLLSGDPFSNVLPEKSDDKAAAATTTTLKKQQSKKQTVKAHPVLNALVALNTAKAARKPEFLRYLEYMKEAGTWDPSSDRPAMHFK